MGMGEGDDGLRPGYKNSLPPTPTLIVFPSGLSTSDPPKLFQ